MTRVEIVSAAPLTTVQDSGRFGMLAHGVTASGPMDSAGFALAGHLAGAGTTAGLEFGAGRLVFRLRGEAIRAGLAGGAFVVKRNGETQPWPCTLTLDDGDEIELVPATHGNFGYVRFSRELDLDPVLSSRSTSLIAALGGYQGRQLAAGDVLDLMPAKDAAKDADSAPTAAEPPAQEPDGPIRVIWGLHANRFSNGMRQRFLAEPFRMSPRLDRMGARLEDISGVFRGEEVLSLVSDTVVPGDIQILGDGTPIVLMRDHQPTGGYPRIATVITPDIDRLAQTRPGRQIRFTSVTVTHAHAIARGTG